MNLERLPTPNSIDDIVNPMDAALLKDQLLLDAEMDGEAHQNSEN